MSTQQLREPVLSKDGFYGQTQCPDGPSTFQPFPLLPPEIRLQIWQLALQGRERIVHLHVAAGFETQGSFPPGLIRSMPSPAASYIATVDGYDLHSKLLRTNMEARAAALAIYRVPLPVIFGGKNARQWRHTINLAATSDGLVHLNPTNMVELGVGPVGILYLSPEHDFLQISVGRGTVLERSHISADFIMRLAALDPRGVGSGT